ncbi:unnamed protein product [Medioppia subpectinata]|uniref:F-box domain-containing protein n=1 Tax=Medioppia subpectinata TaxID=1979941 RepID=A0A7R9KLS0_9ACAR|nr:unnamed protein product [Medioppia subpectinata]CAG2105602.1 unnamed protein product [Medioppia subpectinata]
MSGNSLSDIMDVLSHIMKGSVDLLGRRQTHITDLDEHSFHHILQYLSLFDVFLCRKVNKYFLRQIDAYLENCRQMTYNCKLNGDHFFNGEHVFNGRAFDSVVARMPNIRVMRFKRCPKMRSSLATTNYNIVSSLTNHLIMLNELHLTRCRSLDTKSLKLLVEWFPNLTHLTLSVYNETSVEIIAKGFANLKYFSLEDSVLEDYGNHLQHLGLKIHTFVAAVDHNNHKNSLITGLLNGNGRYLRALDMRIKVFDSDYTLFNTMGTEFNDLLSLKLVFQSKRTVDDNQMLSGLSGLSSLTHLHLEENRIYSNFQSVFEDNSMLSIMRNCRQLESLSLISGGKHAQTSSDDNNTATNFRSLTDASLSMIDQLLPNIRHLSLKSIDITDRTLSSIERLYKLKSLRLDSLAGLTFDGLQEFMTNATQINRLEVINCLNHK